MAAMAAATVMPRDSRAAVATATAAAGTGATAADVVVMAEAVDTAALVVEDGTIGLAEASPL